MDKTKPECQKGWKHKRNLERERRRIDKTNEVWTNHSFSQQSDKRIEINTNSNRHDKLSEDYGIENTEYEEELVEQRKEKTENKFLHKSDNKK